MSPRAAARGYAAGRVALGAGLLAVPGVLGRPWLGPVVAQPGPRVALRALGARDLVLGALALRSDDPRWPLAGAAADAVDCLATLAARSALPRAGSALVAAMAASGAATGALVAAGLSRSARSGGSAAR